MTYAPAAFTNLPLLPGGFYTVGRPRCQHCGHVPANKPRRLCYRCYRDPAVKPLYPVGSGNPLTAKSVPRQAGGLGADAQETLEDLERLIAERYPTMPPATPHEREYRPPPRSKTGR